MGLILVYFFRVNSNFFLPLNFTSTLLSSDNTANDTEINQHLISIKEEKESKQELPGGLGKIIGDGRYKDFRTPTKDELSKINSSQAIEIECEWNNDATVPVSYCYNCYN